MITNHTKVCLAVFLCEMYLVEVFIFLKCFSKNNLSNVFLENTRSDFLILRVIFHIFKSVS